MYSLSEVIGAVPLWSSQSDDCHVHVCVPVYWKRSRVNECLLLYDLDYNLNSSSFVYKMGE